MEVKYFKLIVIIKSIYIDPKKVYIITKQQAPNYIKDV